MVGTSAATLLGVTAFLYFVVFCLAGKRVYERVNQRRLRWDDYCIATALGLAILQWSLVIAATTYGLGGAADETSQTSRIQAHHLLFASELVWVPSIAFVRIGVAFTVLHFKQSRPWRIVLSILIAVQVLLCIIGDVFQVLQCIPLQEVWNESPYKQAVCIGGSSILSGQYVHAGVGTATDLILTLTPLSFLQHRRNLSRETAVVTLVVCLGLFATACSTRRATLLQSYSQTSNLLQDAIPMTMWSIFELQASLIAANIASLKAAPAPPLLYKGYRHAKSRRTSSIARIDSYQLPPLHLSLTQPYRGSHGVDTNVSSQTGLSTLNRMRSDEFIWPRENRVEATSSSDEVERYDSAYEQMMAAGGILMTTELEVRSEILSHAGSCSGERVQGQDEDMHIRREEWRMVDSEAVKGDWSAV